jgi:hypothetical protein
MKIKICIFDLVAEPNPQRFHRNQQAHNNKPRKNRWNKRTLNIFQLTIVYKRLSGIFVDLHEKHVANENLRYGYFQTFYRALKTPSRTFATDKF